MHSSRNLRRGRYTGCNVTTPYKALMAARCDCLEGDAESLGVVNTITVRGGRLLGVTTDADGFELALSEAIDVAPSGRDGAGARCGRGSRRGRAGAHPGAAPSPAHRRAPGRGRCRTLVDRLRGSGDIATIPWDRDAIAATSGHSAIVVNATPVGLDVAAVRSAIGSQRRAASSTSAIDRVRSTWWRPPSRAGHRASDGLEMLLQQGLLSFEIWTGKVAPAAAVRSALLRAVEA